MARQRSRWDDDKRSPFRDIVFSHCLIFCEKDFYFKPINHEYAKVVNMCDQCTMRFSYLHMILMNCINALFLVEESECQITLRWLWDRDFDIGNVTLRILYGNDCRNVGLIIFDVSYWFWITYLYIIRIIFLAR